jgi:beta-lactamase regulating signal transducer with metallopeptidase domain
MKKFMSWVIIWGSLLVNKVFALTIETVNLTQSSTPVGWQANRLGPITSDSKAYLNIINIINDYLWFWLAAVCVGVLVYVGIKLMTAQWDKTKMQETNRALVGIIIGLALAYFSYTIIRMIANWF